MNALESCPLYQEIESLRLLKYADLCEYLKEKYGAVPGPYFSNSDCKSKNQKIKRSEDGLFIHHIFENKAIMLSTPKYAIDCPFEWQEGENLVYCNYFEHLLLHVAIVKEFTKKEFRKTKTAVGLGGILNFIFPEVIDYINGYGYSREYMKRALSVIDGNELLFVEILADLKAYIFGDKAIERIARKVVGGDPLLRIWEVFVEGRNTSDGKFRGYLFEYDVIRGRIPLMSSSDFVLAMERVLSGFAYNFGFSRYEYEGKYHNVYFYYENEEGEQSLNCAMLSNEKVNFNKFKKEHLKRIIDPKNTIYRGWIKKESVISYKEAKVSDGQRKWYWLTIDGVPYFPNQTFTKKEAEFIVKANRPS